MRTFTRLAAVLSIAGVFAPIAANADVGTSIYQPGPIIVHAKPATPNNKVADGRSVYNHQLKAIHNNQDNSAT
jgi:hypothetical protein